MKKALPVILWLLLVLTSCQAVGLPSGNDDPGQPTAVPSTTPIDLHDFFDDMEPMIPQTGITAPPRLHPGARMWASLLFDPEIQKPVLYGGGKNIDAWTLEVNGGRWREIESGNAPDLERLGGVGAALDTAAGRLIIFFYKGENLPGETWALDLHNQTWTNLRPKNQPLSRRFTTLVYDSQADKILLFGGVLGDDETRPSDELWAYDFPTNTWTELQAANSPPPAFYLHAAYDSDMQKMIVWGGKPLRDENNLWQYDYSANRWEKVSYEEGPAQDYDGAMAYAPGLKRTLLYIREKFWAYDASARSWESLPQVPGLGITYAASLVYDPVSEKIVLYGGANQNDTTWVYDPTVKKWRGYPAIRQYQ